MVCLRAQNKLVTLKENAQSGTDALDKAQQEAITKIKDVHLQLELVKDLQKQFGSLQAEVIPLPIHLHLIYPNF